MEKISIIVPVYNVELYIERCIRSILGQTFKNFELILVDDGSIDSSLSICKRFLFDKRVNVYHKENGGISSARNFGLDNMTGDYVCFIDSDDYISANYLSTLYKLLNDNDADIAQCEFTKFYTDEDPIVTKNISNIKVYKNENIMKEYFKQGDSEIRIHHNVWCKIYKKEIFDNLRFNEEIVYEDLAIIYLLLSRAKKFAITNEVNYFYYKGNRDSFTNNYSLKYLTSSYYVLEKMNTYFLEKDYVPQEYYQFSANQLINSYEESFKIKEKIDIVKIYRKKIKNLFFYNIKKSDLSIIGKLKMYIRVLLPGIHRKYKVLLKKYN